MEGEHKFLQQSLRESTLVESYNPASSLLLTARVHGSSVAMTKPSLPEPDLPTTYTSPFPLLFLPELKIESKPSVVQPQRDAAAQLSRW